MLDGMGTCLQYVQKAKEMDFQYLGCTDHGSVSGLIQFQKACDKEGIKPVLGCELYLVKDISDKTKENKPNHMTVFVKDDQGWGNLLQILSFANMEGFYRRPRVNCHYLLNHCEGLVILTGCVDSFLMASWGMEFLVELEVKMPDPWDLYFEVMPHEIDVQKKVNREAVRLAWETVAGVTDRLPPLVATNDCHYVEQDDWEVQEVLLAIQRKAKWNDPDRWTFGIKGLYLRTFEEMKRVFYDQGVLTHDETLFALEGTLKVARKCCDFRIKRQEISLPQVRGYKDDPNKNLRNLCETGDKAIYLGSFFEPIYKERFEEEFKLISEKNFSQYFIIVKELVDWCTENAILVGPGRGSVGGCLIAYLLGITTVDPIKYGLLFSRFIAEDRIDFPDIDLDFQDDKRHLVRQHLEEMYGSNNVANIATFLRMKGRGAIRDVCRVFDVPLKEADEFAKVIDDGGDKREDTRIEEAIRGTDVGRAFARKYSKVAKMAQRLEGQVRGYGKHAAGIVVSAEDLTLGTRCNLIKRGNDEGVAINWEMNDAEYVGLMKLDILGLSTLTILSECQRLIKENQGVKLEFEGIPLDDPKVYEDLSKGHTVGTFQFSGYSCTELIKRMGVRDFEDLALAISLARPGPAESGMTDLFVERRKGKAWKKSHSIYEEITKNTLGVIVYQEQIMEVIYKVAGLPYSTADRIRKVVGKKRDAKEFEPYRIQFLNGCSVMKTFSLHTAEVFWKGLLEWAHYGFNKCLTGDTLLTRSSYNQYTGKHISLGDLYLDWNKNSPAGNKYRSQGLDIMQMSGDCRCRPGKVVGVYYQGKKSVFEIRTETGKNIKATGNHRLYTYEGYIEVQNLKIGDRLGVMGVYQQSITERKGQKWKQVSTKGMMGFQEGESNPAYVDGRSILFEQSKREVFKRAEGFCEKCGVAKDKRFEFAHIKTIEEYAQDYSIYHRNDNILYLCNGCHKAFDYQKKERKKRFEKGYPIYFDSIVEIEEVGVEEVFDLEMEGPDHNFIANDIVSHNSHAVEYALIGYWTAWLKLNYPREFLCATLTHEPDYKKNVMVKEAYRLGFDVMPPKAGISESLRWLAKGNIFYAPFVAIKGIGEKKALQASGIKNKVSNNEQAGFFSVPKGKGKETQLEGLLREIGAFEPGVPKGISKYFDFTISSDPRILYPNLFQIFPSTRPNEVEKIVKGLVPYPSIFKKMRFDNDYLLVCKDCELRKECQGPVMPSKGLYNIIIAGEGPGRDEDLEGEGFVGPAGRDVLWPEFRKYGLRRIKFHVTNVVKCYPKVSKTPGKQHIQKCLPWLREEAEAIECRLMLVFGNTGVRAILDEDGGIIKRNGTTEWVDRWKVWVCWCVHPASVLHNPKANREFFEIGVRNFVQTIKSLGGIDEILF